MESRWIWPFELLEKIGEGGMGVVYRARYVGNDRKVAVKLIPNDVTANPTLLARIEREVEVLTALSHPNIVHCFGGRCETKQRFYAMEYIPGGTLSDLLQQKGELPWETACDFAIQMCEALQYAHERGITHRDVKPGNFLLTKSGQLKLSDFGLASIASEGRLTASGRTVGTILYMSPEQIRGEPVTTKVDLYGLGCVIFEMLVGSPPYLGNNPGEILQQHLKAPIPHVARQLSECPLELDQLICELLAKEPDQRPVSAADVASRLNGILLPSRRKAYVEPQLFGSLAVKGAPTVPIKLVKRGPTQSTPKVESARKPLAPSTAWIACGILMCLFGWSWYGWSQATSQLHQAEQTWVDLLSQSQPETRILAARALAKFRVLRPSSIEKLRDSAMSPIVDVRLAALAALKQHAVASRSMNAELVRMQKVDENTYVRAEAGHVLAAIQQAKRPTSSPSLVLPCLLLLMVAGTCAGSWWIWKRFKLMAG